MNEITWEQYIKELNISPEYMETYEIFLDEVKKRYGDDKNAKDSLAKVLSDSQIPGDYLMYGYAWLEQQNMGNFFDMLEKDPSFIKELNKSIDKIARENAKEEDKEKDPVLKNEEEKIEDRPLDEASQKESDVKDANVSQAKTEDVRYSVATNRENVPLDLIKQLAAGNVANDIEEGKKSEEQVTNEYAIDKIITAACNLGYAESFAINESLTLDEQKEQLNNAVEDFEKDLERNFNENGSLMLNSDGQAMTASEYKVNIINENSKEVPVPEGMSPDIDVQTYNAAIESMAPAYVHQCQEIKDNDYLKTEAETSGIDGNQY